MPANAQRAESDDAQPGNRPVDKVRIGNISASIWRNSGEKGDFYTVSLERSYKDGENWKTTHTLGQDDLLEVSKVLDKAHDRIVELQQGRGRA